MTQPSLVLASASAARAELLAGAGFRFEVLPAPDGAESAALSSAGRRGVGPEETVLAAAAAKAQAVAGLLPPAGHPAVVLAADTVAVSARGRLLGKGRDDREDAAILAELAGTRHRVLTGVVVLACNPPAPHVRREFVDVTEVEMSPMTAAGIAAYVAAGHARGAAGAYRLQRGGTDRFVRIVAGSFSNVVGLPMERIIPALAELGVRPAGDGGGTKG